MDGGVTVYYSSMRMHWFKPSLTADCGAGLVGGINARGYPKTAIRKFAGEIYLVKFVKAEPVEEIYSLMGNTWPINIEFLKFFYQIYFWKINFFEILYCKLFF